MTPSRALRTAALAAAVLGLAAACATASAHTVGSARPAVAGTAPLARESAQDELSALPEQIRTVATACETALIPVMGAAEAGQNVITPTSCKSLTTHDYQIATLAAEQQYYLQTHPTPTPTP